MAMAMAIALLTALAMPRDGHHPGPKTSGRPAQVARKGAPARVRDLFYILSETTPV
jgi:hypothetical protein